MKKKVVITTLGCKVNQFESAAFSAGFEEAGFEVCSSGEGADIVVLNTCAVTARAGAQSRQSLRRALRNNPEARIVITGCYTEIAAEELQLEKELRDRDYTLIGNSRKDSVVSAALQADAGEPQRLLGAINKAEDISRLPLQRFSTRSRAYLKIQDGCESFCSYCIVPYTRGPSRSLPPNEVLDQALIFTREGHREIVLTGIHLGYFGADLQPKESIVTLLDRLTRATPQTCYRISSLEPLEISKDLLSLMTQRDNIQPHLHIPLQSGDDEILRAMNRRYTTAEFREVIRNCQQALPDLAIGIDILAGFPGETDAHFESTMDFLQTLEFAYLHVFPYSIRPGTVAATLDGQLPSKVKEQRVGELRKLSEHKRELFYRRHLGSTRQVLVENQRDETGRLKGYTDNYITVRFNGPDSLLGGFTSVRLESLHQTYVIGERVDHNEG